MVSTRAPAHLDVAQPSQSLITSVYLSASVIFLFLVSESLSYMSLAANEMVATNPRMFIRSPILTVNSGNPSRSSSWVIRKTIKMGGRTFAKPIRAFDCATTLPHTSRTRKCHSLRWAMTCHAVRDVTWITSILLMQVVGDNKWSIVSSVDHTFICAYQRAADGHLDSL